MSDCIFLSDIMVSNSSKEWHGKAVIDPNVQTIEDAIASGGQMYNPVHTSPLTFQGSNIIVPGFKATYRQIVQDGRQITQPLGIVGENYQVLQNEEAVKVFTAPFEAGLLEFQTEATLNDGKRFFFCASFTQGGRANILPGDPLYRCVVLMNSHDGNSAMRVLITNIRVVCGNTWQAALKSKLTQMISSRHTVNIKDNLESFEQAINYDEATWQAEEVAALQHMAGVHISGKVAELYLKQTISARKPLTQAQIDNERQALPEEAEEAKARKNHVIESIKKLHEESACSATPGYRGCVYGWYQSVLEFLQYESGHETKQFDARLYDQIQGENVDRTKLAYENALALCR